MGDEVKILESDERKANAALVREKGQGPQGDEAGAQGPPAEADAKAQLDAARREVEELLTRLKYLQAEFDNLRKRAAKEMEAVVRFANEALLARLLPVLDTFDAAAEKAEGEAGKAIRLVREGLFDALREAGLQEIPAEGGPFDPYVHECVERVRDAGLRDGIVKGVVQKGYRVHDRVLRPAQVIVVNNGGESDG